MSEVWVVRLGEVRGKGEYIAARGMVPLKWSPLQRRACKFYFFDDAMLYARCCGGRVVRLRRKGGGR